MLFRFAALIVMTLTGLLVIARAKRPGSK